MALQHECQYKIRENITFLDKIGPPLKTCILDGNGCKHTFNLCNSAKQKLFGNVINNIMTIIDSILGYDNYLNKNIPFS